MEENNRHYNMIEILKQIEHFDTNEMSRIKELDERLQFLESLLPKLPTATHYDATQIRVLQFRFCELCDHT